MAKLTKEDARRGWELLKNETNDLGLALIGASLFLAQTKVNDLRDLGCMVEVLGRVFGKEDKYRPQRLAHELRRTAALLEHAADNLERKSTTN